MSDELNDTNSGQNGGEEKGRRLPPYHSFKTTTTFMEDQQQHGVPNQIDRSVLTRFSGSVGTQLLNGLKFLGLIDDGQRVQPELHELVQAYGTEEWPDKLRAVIERAYAPLIRQDLARMTPQQFHEVFKGLYDAKEAVVRKCEVFFLHAAKAANIPINERIIKHRAARTSMTMRRTGARNGKVETARDQYDGDKQPPGGKRRSRAEDGPPKSEYQVLIGMLDPIEMDEDEQEAVWTLIRYVKRRDIEASMEAADNPNESSAA